ncbi:lipase [Blastococcus sp. LR1]|uniref:lipase family alpha/beta hydrolase n=1 Tax=Blastococcus sp. LR1 TaxID=2877000 RepID=UPI001CCACCFD|nr:lipase [Blastococcus sp. LR1]MCA0143609.1 lipase [Blastococcus sp. LR1]
MSSDRRARRLPLVLLIIALVGAAVVAALLIPWGDAPAPREEVAAEEPGPVLLVPGYGGSVESMGLLAGRLRTEGRDATVVPWPAPGTGDLRQVAANLDDAARDALDRTGAESVDVVGYSAGGLVARIWITDGNADLARRVVTLGAPHHGTDVAQLGATFAPESCPEACLQMVPGSELLTALAEDETPDGVDWISVWTTQDTIVTPPETARLDGAVNVTVQSVCADRQVGHMQLPVDPVVQAIVVRQLGAQDLAPLTAEDCSTLDG